MAPAARDSSPPPSGPAVPTVAASAATPADGCGRVLAGWSLSRLAAQTLTVPVNEQALAAAVPLVAAGAGAVILFGGYAPADLAAGLRTLASQGAVAPLVMTDEEGGQIQRVADLVGSMPWPRQMAASLTPAQVSALAAEVGTRMHALGIGMDLAPVADLDSGAGPSEANPDGPRSFSADPGTASAYVRAFAQGLLRAGVLPVVKHFPGLGGVGPNTDVATGYTPPLTRLVSRDLQPFRDAFAAGAPAVMVANAIVPGLTALPASLSELATTGLLQDQLGFHGLVLTDSLSAQSIANAGYGLAAAAPTALAAGADLLLYGGGQSSPAEAAAGFTQMVSGIVAAVQSGRLGQSRLQDAVRHVLRAKGLDGC